MIFDYEEQEGYVSLWIGKCKDYSVVDEYLSTKYFDEDFDGDIEKTEQSEIWKKLFVPANRDRSFEEELKEMFNYEFFNQFEYDFGLSFDEDCREAQVLDCNTRNLEKLFSGFSYSDSFLDKVKEMKNSHLPDCNTAVVLYDFKYDGSILKAEHENFQLYFFGYCKYDIRQ